MGEMDPRGLRSPRKKTCQGVAGGNQKNSQVVSCHFLLSMAVPRETMYCNAAVEGFNAWFVLGCQRIHASSRHFCARRDTIVRLARAQSVPGAHYPPDRAGRVRVSRGQDRQQQIIIRGMEPSDPFQLAACQVVVMHLNDSLMNRFLDRRALNGAWRPSPTAS